MVDDNEWEEQIHEHMSGTFKELMTAMEYLHEQNPELSTRVKEELEAAARGEENILLIGTDGEFSVTILHLPQDVIGRDEELVTFPTSSSISILAAIPRESLDAKVRMCEAIEDDGSGALADEMWDDYMGQLMARAVELHKENPKTF